MKYLPSLLMALMVVWMVWPESSIASNDQQDPALKSYPIAQASTDVPGARSVREKSGLMPPDFMLSVDSICAGEPVNVITTDLPAPGITIDWVFDGADTVGVFDPFAPVLSWSTGGTKTVMLLVSEPSMPTDTLIDSLYVWPLPQPTLVIDTIICLAVNTQPINLFAQFPSGAMIDTSWWSGPGVIDGANGVFDPIQAGLGTHTLNFNYVAGPCSDVNSIDTRISQRPESGQVPPPIFLCATLDTVLDLAGMLIGADPGGVWTEAPTSPSAGAAFDPNQATVSTAGLAPNEYTFRYRVAGVAPCPDAATDVVLTIYPLPTSDAGSDMTLDCDRAEVELGGSGTSTGTQLKYQWISQEGHPLTDDQERLLTVNLPGTYILQVRDTITGCVDESSVQVMDQTDRPSPFASGLPVSCFGQSDGAVIIDSVEGGRAPYTFFVNGDTVESKTVIGGLAAGTYELIVRDDGGCEGTTQVDIPDKAQITINVDANIPGGGNILQLGSSATLSVLHSIPPSELDSLDWSPDPCPGCASITVSPLETTTYTATVLRNDGCRASAEYDLVVDNDPDIFFPNAFSPNEDGRNDRWIIFTGQEVVQVRSLKIYSRWGSQVFSLTNFAPNDPLNGWDGMHNGKPLKSGVYLYWAELELIGGTLIQKTGDINLIR